MKQNSQPLLKSLLLLIAFTCGCTNLASNDAGLSSSEKQKVRRELSLLIEAKKFDEARLLAQKNGMPKGIGLDLIESNEKCVRVMDKCEVVGDGLAKPRACLSDLKNSCDEEQLILKNQSRFKTVHEQLIKKGNIGSLESSHEAICSDGMKWGYLRGKKKVSSYIAFTMIIDYSKLYGSFDSLDACNKARLLEGDEIVTSKECHRRYVNENKSLKVYLATAMRNNNKLILRFKEENECKKAVEKGFQYNDQEMQGLLINSINSSKPERFIKACEVENLLICEKNKQSSPFEGEIF